ncbi:Hypothetical leucine rich repeat protein [Ectocarpus siliculosus]|uniref:Hypothetical leucine rich repeat protein n=1 Tax=Ectocarpus siliculosus TaxID=2880 RepID=D7G0L6_ECTSI|nr:Hypothetical leucine rich repeat protein [Ectocarpus siliculosus]|eukprot:CBJ33045.1 Hypothetical leucine rich repeat protein [Ectocarpus siliculosus]
MAENEGYGKGGVAIPADENKSTDDSDNRHQDAGATPRTSRCSEEEPNDKTDKKRDDGNDEGENDEYEEYEEDEVEDDDNSDERSGGGSLWFKAERIVITLQLLALALDVYGAPWPPLFVRMWSWVWLTNQYLRWPALVLLRRVGREFSLTFGDAQLDLWFFRDVIGYGVEVCAASVAVFVFFFVLQMPDYTSSKPKAAWRRSFLTHWFRRTLPRYLLNLGLCYVAFAGVTYFGEVFVPPDVVKAVIVVGGTLLTVSWILVVLLSLLVHVNVRMATKHDAEYSFMIAMKHVVKTKGRTCLFFLHLAYVPLTASIVRALVPEFDWNDKWAHESRREYNHHVWCNFMGFPPQLEGTAEMIVLECTSTSGVAVHTLSACLVLFFACGLPNMVRYLVRFLFEGFNANVDVIRSFLQAREVHQSTLEALTPFPKDVVWLARRRREIAFARNAANRLRRRALRVVVVSLRRVPLVRRLPGIRPRRRKKQKRSLADTGREKLSISDEELGATTATVQAGLGESVRIEEDNKDPPAPIGAPGTTLRDVDLYGPGDKHSTQKTLVLSQGTTGATALLEGVAGVAETTTARSGPEETKRPYKAGGGETRKKNELQRRQQQQALTEKSEKSHSRLEEFWRRRRKASVGMRQALQAEREAFANASQEFILALSDFESDHSLEITCWESVVDTSGLLYLSESYTWQRSEWKVVEGLERGAFVTAVVVSQHLGPASTQLLVGALVLAVFQTWTFRAEPFLYYREALLDTGLRVALILVLCIGAAGAGGAVPKYVVDTFLLAVGLAGIAAALVLGEVVRGAMVFVGKTLAAADERVNDLLFRQIFVVRWASLRGLDISRARTSTGLSLLHDSVINAEVEPTRWLVHLYPVLLHAETLHKESPLLLGILETARVLLRMEALTARLNDWGLDLPDSASQAGQGSLLGGLGLLGGNVGGGLGSALGDMGGMLGGGVATEEIQKEADEEEVAALAWKVGRLAEMFLSNELQNAELRWNAHQYDLLTEHGEPDLSELAQNLAEAFNVKPPKGYAHVHRWRKRARFTRDCLGEATCASRSDVDLAGCGLGDRGYKSLLSICRALSVQATTFTWPSPYTTQVRINVVRVDLSGNRMRRKSGYRIADMLLLNKTITDLNLSANALDSGAAKEIFFAARKNQVLKRLDISGNKIGPEAASGLAGMVTKNRSLTYLDLSDNQMGERKFWLPTGEIMHVPSAGPSLGDALRYNRTLTVLKVKGNLFGADTGHAFASGVARHRSLTWLVLSGNLLLPGGGKALALRLNAAKRSTLTRLDVSDNHVGKKAATLFSATLKRNRTLRHLDLSRNELGTHAGIAFATSLLVNRTLETLAIAGNGMGPNVAKNLGQSLAKNSSLKDLDLSDNVLGIATAEGGDPSDLGLALGHGLRINKTLTSINLSGNRLPTLEMQRIAEGLADHQSLAHLTLTGEAVNDSAALDLGRLIAQASGAGLVSLDLSRSALAGVGAVAVTRALTTGAHGLERLDLSDNSLSKNAAGELASALQNDERGGRAGCGVRFLGLARCGLGPVGGALVCRALGGNRTVEELDMSDNGLGPVAGMALARSLRVLYRNGKTVRPCRMRRLDISRNPLGNEAGVAILGALVNECTQHLDLSYTELRGKAAGLAIGRMLRCHTIVLQHLNVEHNNLGRHGVNEVFWALRRNASLLHLDISDNGAGALFGTEADKLEEYGTTSINSALSLNQTLRFLDLGTNGLSAECGSTLTASIRRNRCLANVSLEYNLLDDQAASTFGRKLRRDRQMDHLNLNNNRVGWRGGLDLAAGLALNSHLTWLDVGNNKLGEAGMLADVGGKFAAALVKNKTLTRLNMEGNTLGPSGGVAIAEALHRNNSLVEINLENNRLDQDVGFALEDLLKVNFTLHSVGASVGEVGIDSRETIDNMLAAREKMLETTTAHDPSQTRYRESSRNSGGGSVGGGSSNGSVGSLGGDSGSEGFAATGTRRPRSARALRAQQAKTARKSSTIRRK